MPRPPKNPTPDVEAPFDADAVQPVSTPVTPQESPTVRTVTRTEVPAEEQMQLLNVTLTANSFSIPKGDGVATVRVRPFEASPPMAETWAAKVIGPLAGKYDPGAPREMPYYHWRQWAPLAPVGTRKVAFKEPSLGGKEFEANGYREKDATRPDGKPMLHSEVQALNFLRVCPNIEDIRLFIETVDGRTVVRLFAADIISLRERQDAERKQIPIIRRRSALPA